MMLTACTLYIISGRATPNSYLKLDRTTIYLECLFLHPTPPRNLILSLLADQRFLHSQSPVRSVLSWLEPSSG